MATKKIARRKSQKMKLVHGVSLKRPICVRAVKNEYTKTIGDMTVTAKAEVHLGGAEFFQPEEVSDFVNRVQNGIALPVI